MIIPGGGYGKVSDGSKDVTAEEYETVVIKVFTTPFDIPPKFSSKDEYAKVFIDLYIREAVIEKLRQPVYFPAKFKFDLTEQRTITKRIILYLK